MIFRRNSRDESFQRQISDLRQGSGDAPPEDEEYTYDYDNAEESPDTSRYSTERNMPDEGISFPSSRSEATAAPVEEPQPASPSMPAAPDQTRWQPAMDSNTSIIAVNAHWNGTLRTDGPLRVHGKADGELHSISDLYVAEGAEVDAELNAESVVVAGLVRGRIHARTRLEVLPQSEVTGDVHSPKLVVHEGATLSGQLKMEAADPRSSGSQESRPPAALNES